jgi:hypothetical protein
MPEATRPDQQRAAHALAEERSDLIEDELREGAAFPFAATGTRPQGPKGGKGAGRRWGEAGAQALCPVRAR